LTGRARNESVTGFILSLGKLAVELAKVMDFYALRSVYTPCWFA